MVSKDVDSSRTRALGQQQHRPSGFEHHLLGKRSLVRIRAIDGKDGEIAQPGVGNEVLVDLDRRAMLDGALVHDVPTCGNIVEGCNEVARIGGALGAFGCEHAADIDGVGVKADRRPHVELKRQPRDMGAERTSQADGRFDGTGRGRRGVAEHRKENVLNRHRRTPWAVRKKSRPGLDRRSSLASL